MDDRQKRRGIIWAASIAGAAATIWSLAGRVHDATWRHVDRFVISTAEGQELQKEVRDAAKQATDAAKIATDTSNALVGYIARQDLKEERRGLERLKGDLADLGLWESTNGANDQSRRRRAELMARIYESEERIRCLEDPDRGGC